MEPLSFQKDILPQGSPTLTYQGSHAGRHQPDCDSWYKCNIQDLGCTQSYLCTDLPFGHEWPYLLHYNWA